MSWASQKHLRDIGSRLGDEGFEVVGHRSGRHVVLVVAKDGRQGTITVASSPADKTNAVFNAMRDARRAVRHA